MLLLGKQMQRAQSSFAGLDVTIHFSLLFTDSTRSFFITPICLIRNHTIKLAFLLLMGNRVSLRCTMSAHLLLTVHPHIMFQHVLNPKPASTWVWLKRIYEKCSLGLYSRALTGSSKQGHLFQGKKGHFRVKRPFHAFPTGL